MFLQKEQEISIFVYKISRSDVTKCFELADMHLSMGADALINRCPIISG